MKLKQWHFMALMCLGILMIQGSLPYVAVALLLVGAIGFGYKEGTETECLQPKHGCAANGKGGLKK